MSKTKAKNSQTAITEISYTVWKIPPALGVFKEEHNGGFCIVELSAASLALLLPLLSDSGSMGRLWCAFEGSHMQLCTNTNMLYVKTLSILPCIFLQFRTGAIRQQNSCREKSYILVAVPEVTEACIDASETKDKNAQSDAFQETLNSAPFSSFFPSFLNGSWSYIVLF